MYGDLPAYDVLNICLIEGPYKLSCEVYRTFDCLVGKIWDVKNYV
jgi:hypothetical protein